MTCEGIYRWDLDIANMKLDEIEALETAIARVKMNAKRSDLMSRMCSLLTEANELGLEFRNKHGELIEDVYLNTVKDPCPEMY